MLTSTSESADSAADQAGGDARASEPDNCVRFDASRARGHVESLFLKGNSPDGKRALWVKYTILAPRANPEGGVAELWAIAFDRAHSRPIANKQSFPLREVSFGDRPFFLKLPRAELEHGRARGELGASGPRFRWDLRYECASESFRPFPSARMYRGPFPRTKTLTPAPDSRLSGFFEIDDERWDVSGFRAAQGHNWGRGHAHAYAWAHANALELAPESAQARETWLELITGRVYVGPLLTPWLSCAGVSIDRQLFRFDGLRSMLAREVHVDARSYQFHLRQGDAEFEGKIVADPRLIAGLRYEDPDQETLSCLNSKLASGTFTLRARGKVFRLRSERVALEIGMREKDHGIPILV
jgi:hypothetical protein